MVCIVGLAKKKKEKEKKAESVDGKRELGSSCNVDKSALSTKKQEL